MRPLNTYLSLLIICISFSIGSTSPTWPPDVGFGNGAIDLGGLLVSQMKTFTEVWRVNEGGADNTGVNFCEPTPLPDGFYMFGSYIHANNDPLSGWILAGKDLTNDNSILKSPVDYSLVLNSSSLTINQDGGTAYIWQPTPPEGCTCIGSVVTVSPEKPPLDKIRCVRSDFALLQTNGYWMWGANDDTSRAFNLYSSLTDGGGDMAALPIGTFLVHSDGSTVPSIPYLKNVDNNLSSMPDVDQIDELMKQYGPVIYFHPDEEFFPSSVQWFFDQGGILFTKGPDSNPIIIGAPSNTTLPQGGWNDGLYWLDLVYDDDARARVKAGNLEGADANVHIKPTFGTTYTDIAINIFYPFNGPAKARFLFFNIDFKKLGEHVGDWEHVTLRISNFDGELKRVYFSQHSKGEWVDAANLQYLYNNKPVVYSSLHGHAAYPWEGNNMNGKDVGLLNKAAFGPKFMDTGLRYTIICADHLNPPVEEPYWLNYAREWGPVTTYDIAYEMNAIKWILPGKLKGILWRFLQSLPSEIFGEEGPVGPKYKDNWSGDERA